MRFFVRNPYPKTVKLNITQKVMIKKTVLKKLPYTFL